MIYIQLHTNSNYLLHKFGNIKPTMITHSHQISLNGIKQITPVNNKPLTERTP